MNPETEPSARCLPPIAVFLWGRIPFTPDHDVPDDFDLAPAWVIEILSAEQSPIRVIETILYALRSGCSLGGIGFESGLCDSDLV